MSARKILFLAAIGLGLVGCLLLVFAPWRVDRRSPRGTISYTLSIPTSGAPDALGSGSGPRDIKFYGHTSFVQGVVISPDGKTLASGSSDNTVRLWDVVTGQERATLHGHTDSV